MDLLCTKCNRTLPEVCFQRDATRVSRGGHQYWCRECVSVENAAYHAAHRAQRNARNLARYYANQAAKRGVDHGNSIEAQS